MGMQRAQPLRWDRALDRWYFCTPVALSQAAIKRLIAWALPLQISRYHSLAPGDRKDDLKHAIQRLRDGAIAIHVTGQRGDGKGDILLFEDNSHLEPTAWSFPTNESVDV